MPKRALPKAKPAAKAEDPRADQDEAPAPPAPKLRYAEARGTTFREMVAAVEADPIRRAGDLKLVWVLEADLAAQDVAGA